MERGAEPGAPGAEDQNVRFDRVDYRTQGRVTAPIILVAPGDLTLDETLEEQDEIARHRLERLLDV